MSGNISTVSVTIEARLDKLDAGLRDAQTKTAAAGDRIEKAFKPTSFERLTLGAFKFGAAIQAATGGFTLGSAAIELFRGHTEKARELIERLPLGIGRAIQAFNEFRETLSGAAERAKATAENVARLKKETDDYVTAADAAAKSLGKLQELAAPAPAREVAMRALDAAAETAKKEELAKPLGGGAFLESSIASRDAALGVIEAEAQKARAVVNEKFDESESEQRVAAIVERFEKTNAAEAEGDRKRRALESSNRAKRLDRQDKLTKDTIDRQRKMDGLSSELNEKRLIAEGRTLDAEVERINRSYAERIAAAEEAGDAEQVALLKAGREAAFDEAAAQDKLKAAMKGGRSAEAMTSRVGQFDTAALAIGGKQGNDERRDALLREIRNELRNKKPVAA